MTRQTINTGTGANSNDGDPLRTAFTKINSNFEELYTLIGSGSGNVIDVVGPLFDHSDHNNVTVTLDSVNDRIILDAQFSEIIQDLKGSVFADDSSVMVNAVDNTLHALNGINGNLTGNVTGDVKGSIFGDDSTPIVDVVSNTLNGNLTGNVTGDLYGSVFGDDSTPLIDSIESKINLDGTVKGDIIPDQNIAYDIGSPTNRFRDLWLSGTTIQLGNSTLSSTAGGGITVSGGVFPPGTVTSIGALGFALYDQNGQYAKTWSDKIIFASNSSFLQGPLSYDYYTSGYYIADSAMGNMKYDADEYRTYLTGASATPLNPDGAIFEQILNSSNELIGIRVAEQGTNLFPGGGDQIVIAPLNPAVEDIDPTRASGTGGVLGDILGVQVTSSTYQSPGYVVDTFAVNGAGFIQGWTDEQTIVDSQTFVGLSPQDFRTTYGLIYHLVHRWELRDPNDPNYPIVESYGAGMINSQDISSTSPVFPDQTVPNNYDLNLIFEIKWRDVDHTATETFSFGDGSVTVSGSYNYWTNTYSTSVTGTAITAGTFSSDYLFTGGPYVYKFANGDPTYVSDSPYPGTPSVGDFSFSVYFREITNEVLELVPYYGEYNLSAPGPLYRAVSVPATSIGRNGDLLGDYAFDANYAYYCSANWDGVTNVWKRVGWSADTW